MYSGVNHSEGAPNGHSPQSAAPIHRSRSSPNQLDDWEAAQRQSKDFYDDGSVSFFWKKHSFTVLILFCVGLGIFSASYSPSADRSTNIKMGLGAVLLTFLVLGVTQTPDGPFRRPHPALWRLVFCLSIAYELALIFLLFQTVDDARLLIAHLDPKLGKPLPERSYGGECVIYDKSKPADPFHNVKDKFDVFVPVHFFGWWVKTLILRDWWLCTVLSVMFEVMEYTLEHQLPNFSECWWDHWIMDIVVCNGLGILFGLYTLRYLSMKPYHWRGVWAMPRYRDKLRRVVAQFGPWFWLDFHWRPTASLSRWIGVLTCIGLFLVAELGNFYLKFVLWIPPDHWICFVRILLFAAFGAVSMREVYQYFDDPHCQQFGRQAWVAMCITITETLISAKFDFATVTKPLPVHMQVFWVALLSSLTVWTVWHFFLKGVRTRARSARVRSTTSTCDEDDGAEDTSTELSNGYNQNGPHLGNGARKRRTTRSGTEF